MKKKALARAGAALMTGALIASNAGAVFAASSTESNNVDVTNDLNNSDIIDTSKTGSLTIYKYDITAASQAGIFEEGDVTATGQADSDLEDTLDDYAISGVQFTYLKVGDIEQYSVTADGNTQVKLVYEIPTALADILGLDDEDDSKDDGTENDAVKVSGDVAGISAETACDKTGVLHYTSDQINKALETILTADDIAAKNALEAYIVTDGTAMDYTDEDGYTTEDELELGLYLVVETEVPENVTTTVNPFFVSIPMTNVDDDDNTIDGGTEWFYDITVYPKNQSGNPTLDKLVRNATGDAASTAGASEDYTGVISNFTDAYKGYGALDALTQTAEAFAAQRGDGTYATTNNGIGTIDGYVDVYGEESSELGNTELDNSEDGETTNKVVTTNETVSGEYQYASTTTASSGDTLDYILVSKIPHITSTATFLTQYEFEDILSEGLTYNHDVKIAFYASSADAYINNTKEAVAVWDVTELQVDAYGNVIEDPTAVSTQAYGTITEGTNTGEATLTVAITDKGLEEINGDNTNTGTYGYSDYYMVVYYTVEVNDDTSLVLGDAGNENDVTLSWTRTNTAKTDTLEDQSIVYSYGIDLTKVFSDGNGDYADVTFNIYNQTDGYYVIAETRDSDNIYWVTGKTIDQTKATQFTPAGDGSIQVYGLEGDCYSITELSTTSGYALLADQIVVDISTASRSIQAAVAGWTGQYDDSGDYIDGENTSGKVAMVVGALTSGSATVDGVSAAMLSDTYTSYNALTQSAIEESANAIVALTVTNTKNFTLPLTGGAGLYVVTILGVLAVAGGCWMAFGRKKEDKNMMAA